MDPFGKGALNIFNLGEAPGESDDQRGRQWQGKTGRMLQRAYSDLGVDLFKDCVNLNSTNCRPSSKDGNNRTPTNDEIAACRTRVLKGINQHKPHVIILLGGCAVSSVIGHRWKKDLGGIFRWRGWTIPDRDFNAWLCPVFHPNFVERADREILTIWTQDLERALSMRDEPLPKWKDESKQVTIIEDLSPLANITGPAALDWETTGLKPHDTSRHEIISGSVCDRDDHVWAFMFPKDRQNLARLKRFLVGPAKKIASNMKFEHTWAWEQLHVEIRNWLFDTMLASHVLDNRPEISGLKFQTYVNFGLADYSSEVEKFLRASGKDANEENKIRELVKTKDGRKKLLTYNGMDSIFEFRLAMKQMKIMGLL
jgi:uracil-DNA glycosylase family 4